MWWCSSTPTTDADVRDLTVRGVDADSGGGKMMTHHGNPASLLATVPMVGEPPRRAHLVSIPASDLDIGLEMSATTLAAAQAAVERIVGLLSAAR